MIAAMAAANDMAANTMDRMHQDSGSGSRLMSSSFGW